MKASLPWRVHFYGYQCETSTAPRYKDKKILPLAKRMVYQWLVDEHIAPLRIAIGYHGFKTQSGFRAAISSFYEGKENLPGYGVSDMPSLVISENSSILKTAGLPYSGGWHDEGGWLWLCSSDANPALLMLEFLIDRIERVLGVTVNRGEDVNLEVNSPLVSSMPVSLQNRALYITHHVVPASKVYKGNGEEQWCPYKLSLAEKELLELISEFGGLSVKSKTLNTFKSRHEITDLRIFMKDMLKLRIILQNDDVCTVYPGVVIVKVQSDLYCADNSGDRFAQWVNLRSNTPYGEGLYLRVGDEL